MKWSSRSSTPSLSSYSSVQPVIWCYTKPRWYRSCLSSCRTRTPTSACSSTPSSTTFRSTMITGSRRSRPNASRFTTRCISRSWTSMIKRIHLWKWTPCTTCTTTTSSNNSSNSSTATTTSWTTISTGSIRTRT